MTATMNYPGSRIKSSGQCDKCKRFPGFMQDSGRLLLKDNMGNNIEMVKWDL